MKLLFAACAVLGALGAAGAVNANEKLAQASGCMTCHATDKKLIGPSYKEVAVKYGGDKSAEANLIKKVKGGGQGAWGAIPMPPNPHVKDEDIKSLVQWVLSQK